MLRLVIGLAISLALFSQSVLPQEKWPPPDPQLLAKARAILKQVPLIDGHNDLATRVIEDAGGDFSKVDLTVRQPRLPADIPRLREGMVGAQFWAAYVDSATMKTGGATRHALADVKKIVGLNLLRTMREAERAARELQRRESPALGSPPP
jgi:membrane dipeptidase